ncbi:hypothetical protein VTK56DRAFT_7869 [Thermocarpiscus australiensis]
MKQVRIRRYVTLTTILEVCRGRVSVPQPQQHVGESGAAPQPTPHPQLWPGWLIGSRVTAVSIGRSSGGSYSWPAGWRSVSEAKFRQSQASHCVRGLRNNPKLLFRRFSTETLEKLAEPQFFGMRY